jgi:hypothetical protein
MNSSSIDRRSDRLSQSQASGTLASHASGALAPQASSALASHASGTPQAIMLAAQASGTLAAAPAISMLDRLSLSSRTCEQALIDAAVVRIGEVHSTRQGSVPPWLLLHRCLRRSGKQAPRVTQQGVTHDGCCCSPAALQEDLRRPCRQRCPGQVPVTVQLQPEALPLAELAVHAVDGGFQRFADEMTALMDKLGVERPQVSLPSYNSWARSDHR